MANDLKTVVQCSEFELYCLGITVFPLMIAAIYTCLRTRQVLRIYEQIYASSTNNQFHEYTLGLRHSLVN